QAKRAGLRRGLGLSLYMKNNEGAPSQRAEIRIAADGAVTLLTGAQASGQGHETTFAQIAAERLGLPIERVRAIQGDTALIADGDGTGGSAGLAVAGSAVTLAVEDAIERGKAPAAQILECAAADLEFAGGRYRVAGTDRSVGLLDAVAALGGAAPLTGAGNYEAREKTYANGCHACEVEVDPETGQVRIVAYTTADDAGRILHPVIAEGQVHGGLAQGIGQALIETCVFDGASGQLLSGSFMDYGMPRAEDLPMFAVGFAELPTAGNPLGAKGVGESGTVGALAAVVNAVVDALADFGVEHIDMPLTPARVWAAIHRRR
ncbi:MAG: xanthine dehydrogenase family protein molybdopterin-binding subunit, partial [Alphaproteobacteria bacterium]|nr:xanthine dehydrogenase family protein molybdopterin-binding subunit [Alphaproteobacteria bacterium]